MIKKKDDKIIEYTNEINRLNAMNSELTDEVIRLTALLSKNELDYLLSNSIKTPVNTERE